MDDQPVGYQGHLLQIVDKGQVVAEAPLIVRDAEAAWKVFSEGFGMAAQIMIGTMYNAVWAACHPAETPPQIALRIESQSPLALPSGLRSLNGMRGQER